MKYIVGYNSFVSKLINSAASHDEVLNESVVLLLYWNKESGNPCSSNYIKVSCAVEIYGYIQFCFYTNNYTIVTGWGTFLAR